MTTRSVLRFAAAAACLMAAASVPAAAVEFGQGGRPFEAVIEEGFRVVATVVLPGFSVPVLLLGKARTPDTFMCFQQFRDCQRLVDPPTNAPPGFAMPSAPKPSPR